MPCAVRWAEPEGTREGAYLPALEGSGYFFVEELAVAEMLRGWPLFVGENDDGETVVMVNLNDLFVPGADDTPLMFTEIEPLYHALCDPRPNSVREWLCYLHNARPWREAL